MFTGFVYITLAVYLLLCACTEGHLAHGISFEALLRAAIAVILQGLLRSLKFEKCLYNFKMITDNCELHEPAICTKMCTNEVPLRCYCGAVTLLPSS